MSVLFKTKGQRLPLARASEVLGECYNTLKRRAWDKLREANPQLSAESLKSLMFTEGVDLVCGGQVAHLELRESGFRCWVRSL